MKAHFLKSSINILLIALFTLAIVSCKKDDDDVAAGTATIDGRTVEFDQAWVEYTGAIHFSEATVYGYSLTLASSGINRTAQSGKGHIVTFNLRTPTADFSEAVYNFENDQPVYDQPIVSSGYFSINADLDNQMAEKIYNFSGGALTILNNQGALKINFSLMAQELSIPSFEAVGESKLFEGSYDGAFTLYDVSEY